MKPLVKRILKYFFVSAVTCSGWAVALFLALVIAQLGKIMQADEAQRREDYNVYLQAYFQTAFDGAQMRDINTIMTLRPDLVFGRDKSRDYPYASLAVIIGRYDLVKLFLDHGVNPNLRDPDGNTLLHLAAAVNKNPEIAALLLDKGANYEARDKKNKTPLEVARDANNKEMVTFLELYDPEKHQKPLTKKEPRHKLF